MQGQPDPDRRNLRQIRLAAIVMAATMVIWMGAQLLGRNLGLPVRYVFLFDLAAIAALVWAMFVTYQVHKARRGQTSQGATDKDK
ncbi:hypothetical protein E2K80_04885 [Rhodophyticola sp. CCM32]|uniref:DUF5337 domain-containing protein n=1 Tax=Rhodophyticola sp. CCM32 TaxID=2916397 RepID=UPI00107F71F6|nr:DUF5337 domain-containing protein [Rhodophyticola sp. CCM32]QBY00153.1 hypothetical protein E2K80_04885 [Rhodophyticola sp. CCM32]